ncbi:MAG: prolipoprotein diacylglyceryl transferase [Thermodesulfobacteriota bacterium]|nr:prolipoprotein diacylglyceryl transferase [Thermodesulfobacteriota bacterium]
MTFTAGPVAIRWYGLFFAAAFVSGQILMTAIYRKKDRPVQDLSSLMKYMVIGTIIGARLGHCLFYDPVYYLDQPVRILKIWEGGLASHGGAAGILTALFIYSCKKKDQRFLWLLDRIAIPAALGGSLIRIGNFFNSEIIGHPCRKKNAGKQHLERGRRLVQKTCRHNHCDFRRIFHTNPFSELIDPS